MSNRGKLLQLIFAGRRKSLRRALDEPLATQQRQLQYLLRRAAKCEIGRRYDFPSIRSAEEFARRLPTVDYDSYADTIDRARHGEKDILWPGTVRWFARSSGTTDRSKYIPVTSDGLRMCHKQGTFDVAAIVSKIFPDTHAFDGRLLTLGGSRRIEREGETALTGDLSAILIENSSFWSGWFRTPTRDVALMSDFEQKIDAICRQTVGQHVTSFAGVPSWNLMLMRRILEYTGRENLCQVWPDLEMFIHGGVGFAPYAEHFHRLIPSPRMRYLNTYNASEGFFAISDASEREDMLLMVDYGTYYEFDDGESIVPLEGVRCDRDYEMIISSCNGLWRYRLGDTVRFTDTAPYRIRISGRTKQFINVFGEELMVSNAENALSECCQATGARINEYTVAPVYMTGDKGGRHQWLIEFDRRPDDLQQFALLLDRTLQRLNSDYDAKRHSTLTEPQIDILPHGAFMLWMESRGKSGGQNKVPRLCNDRRYADSIEALLRERGMTVETINSNL